MYADLMQKKCSKCSEVKEIKHFYLIKKKKQFRPECRSCSNDAHNKYMKTENGRVSRQKANDKKNWTSPSQVVYKSHWSRFKKYGVTEIKFKEMLIKQDYRCKICNVLDVDTGKSLCIDHCHATDEVRDLLCTRCNSAVGMIMENVESAKKLVEYLEKHKK